MKAIYNDNSILINLNELVTIRAKILTQYEDYSNAISTGEYLDENDIDKLATQLRETLTWDTLYSMVDSAIFDYMGLKDPNKPNYGEIQPEPGREKMLNEMEKNKKQFEMVDLVSPAWTIQVPRRKK